MSISDGLGPSIFCRKMEKARPMMEEMDGKVVYFLQSRHFWRWCNDVRSTFSHLYLDLAVIQLCFPPGKGINRRNENTKKGQIFYYCKVLMIIFQYCISRRCYSKLLKYRNRFSFWKNNQVLLTDHFFLVENDNSKQKKVGSIEKGKLWRTSYEQLGTKLKRS